MRGVPMSRPQQFGDRMYPTDEEFAERARQRSRARDVDNARTGTFRNEEGTRDFSYTSPRHRAGQRVARRQPARRSRRLELRRHLRPRRGRRRRDARLLRLGHPLVEGIFAHVEDSPLGRVARLEVEVGRDGGEGLVAIYKDGTTLDVIARESTGRDRPDWAAAFRQRPLRMRRADEAADSGWRTMVRRLGAGLDAARRPYALAAIVVRPAR